MIDQLIIGDKASYDDFGASLAKRKIGQPKKKSIKETVPFSNKTYDFSAINGEVYWEERELEYVFEMLAETPEELEDAKTAFSNWIMNVMEEDIRDPFIFGYHFIGTFDDISFDDDEGLDKTTVTVKFTAYPYKVADNVKKYTFIVENGHMTARVINNSAHRVTPFIKANGAFALIQETETSIERWALMAMEGVIDNFMFAVGVSEITLQNPNAEAITVEFSFTEEVL